MYNNPFMYQNLYKPSFLSRLFGGAGAMRGAASGINWGNILTTTQKSLGVINQAIPLIYQVKPIISNAKTMFKIADAIKTDKKSTNTSTQKETILTTQTSNLKNDNKPIFYI